VDFVQTILDKSHLSCCGSHFQIASTSGNPCGFFRWNACSCKIVCMLGIVFATQMSGVILDQYMSLVAN